MIKMLKKLEMFYKVFIVLVDLALINVAYIIAFLIKFNFDLPEFNFTPYMEAMPFITVAALVYFDIYGLLKFYRKTLYDAVISILFVVVLLGITTVAITYFNQGFSFPRSVLLTAPLIQFVLLTSWKAFILYIKRFLTEEASVMIVGNDGEMDEAVEKVKSSIGAMGLKIKYIVDVNDMDKVMKKAENVSEIIICPDVPDDSKMKILS